MTSRRNNMCKGPGASGGRASGSEGIRGEKRWEGGQWLTMEGPAACRGMGS